MRKANQMRLPFPIRASDRHVCPKCLKIKSRSKDFYKRRNGQYVAWCKTCDKETASLGMLKRQVKKLGMVWLDEYIESYERLLKRAKELRQELIEKQKEQETHEG